MVAYHQYSTNLRACGHFLLAMVTKFDSFGKESDRLNNNMIESAIMFKVRYHRRPKIRVPVSHYVVRSPTREGYHH